MRRLTRPEEPAELAQARKAGVGSRSPGDAWSEFAGRHLVRATLLQAQEKRCAYCESGIGRGDERDLDHHIDHHCPKSAHPGLTFEWENLLVSCSNRECCGHRKGNNDYPALLDPYRDPTDAWLVYVSDGNVVAREGLDAETTRRVVESIRILGLDCDRLKRKRKAVMAEWQRIAAYCDAATLDALWSDRPDFGFPSARAQAQERILPEPTRDA